VTVCDRGKGGPRACDITLFFIHFFIQLKPKIESDAFCCNGCILTEGGMDKTHPGQNLPDKTPLDKNTCKLRQIPCNDICMYVLLKIGGFRDV